MTINIDQKLQQIFGYKSYRPQQRDIITNILSGQDTLVLMPTGAGKSVCYQIPAFCQSGVSVVISPLLSLIHDQIHDLKKHGQLAHQYSSTSTVLLHEIVKDIGEGRCNLLYTTPESLTTNTELLRALEDLQGQGLLQRFIIDEAHCVSSWGHDFRPAYLQLHMKKWFPGIQICAFTATATKVVSHDIIRNLSLRDPVCTRTSFIKSNIQYRIRIKDNDSWSYMGNSLAKTIRELGHTHSTGIVYCLSRRECEYMSRVLKNRGMAADYYHARLTPEKKEQVQNQWLNGKLKVIVATIAFALGINKPDVRYVIHTSMPKSIESYYQQTGRAGRDGKMSYCVMYYSEKDKNILSSMAVDGVAAPVRNIDRINDIYHLCRNTKYCIKVQMSNYLGEYLVRERCQGHQSEIMCANCQNHIRNPNQSEDRPEVLNQLLDRVDGQELQHVRRHMTFQERCRLSKLLNNGNLITELSVDGTETVHKVIEY